MRAGVERIVLLKLYGELGGELRVTDAACCPGARFDGEERFDPGIGTGPSAKTADAIADHLTTARPIASSQEQLSLCQPQIGCEDCGIRSAGAKFHERQIGGD